MSHSPQPSSHVDVKNKIASLPVSARTNVANLAGALWKFIQEGYAVNLSVIGAGALNQGVKAVTIARSMAASSAKSLLILPAFQQEKIDGVNRTSMRLYIVVQDVVPSGVQQ